MHRAVVLHAVQRSPGVSSTSRTSARIASSSPGSSPQRRWPTSISTSTPHSMPESSSTCRGLSIATV
jgi:hypothetical protein